MTTITRLLAAAILCAAVGVAAQTNAERFLEALLAADVRAVEAALKRGQSPVKPIAFADAPVHSQSPMRWLLGDYRRDDRPDVIDSNRVKVARMLMARGAKIEPSDDLMYVAVALGHAGVAKLLLDANQDIGQRLGGYLPTELAALNGHQDLYSALVARGGKTLGEKEKIQLKLMRGVGERNRSLVAMAIEAGADIDAHDPSGNTALTSLLAWPILDRDPGATEANLDFLGVLVQSWKANPAIPSVGRSPTFPIIQWVQMNSFIEEDFELSAKVIKALVRSGADVNVVDGLEQSALHKAAEHGNLPAAQALVEAGIRHKTLDFRGRTALDLSKDPAIRAFLRTLP